MNSSSAACGLLAFLLALIGGACSPAVQAQPFRPSAAGPSSVENIEGLTVAGKGAVAARPNLLEIDLEVVSASELTADAIVKYRDARRKIQEAFAALKLANVTVEERGLLVDKKGSTNPYAWRFGEPSTRAKTEIQLSRKLVVKGADIRTMDEDALLQLTAKLLDVAQDAGAKVGGGSDFDFYAFYWGNNRKSEGLIRFVLDDFEKLQEEAYEKAIADARTRALRLARLSRIELGPIVAVREVNVPGDPEETDGDEQPRKRLVATKFQEIPIRVELLVRFEVRPKADDKGRTGD